MKTSAKILLGFLLIIFLVPTTFFITYAIKAKNTDFKSLENAYSPFQRIDIGPARFIKIAAPEKDLMECTLIPADKPYYQVPAWQRGNHDSIKVEQKADTMFVTYMDNKHRNNLSIELHLNDWQQLDVSNASITVDSSFGNKDVARHININNSKLNIGAVKDEDDPDDNDQKAQSVNPILISNLNLTGNDNNIFISNTQIGNLRLAITGGQLNIAPTASINKAEGAVSQSTQLKLAGNNLRTLSSLIVQ